MSAWISGDSWSPPLRTTRWARHSSCRRPHLQRWCSCIWRLPYVPHSLGKASFCSSRPERVWFSEGSSLVAANRASRPIRQKPSSVHEGIMARSASQSISNFLIVFHPVHQRKKRWLSFRLAKALATMSDPFNKKNLHSDWLLFIVGWVFLSFLKKAVCTFFSLSLYSVTSCAISFHHLSSYFLQHLNQMTALMVCPNHI